MAGKSLSFLTETALEPSLVALRQLPLAKLAHRKAPVAAQELGSTWNLFLSGNLHR